MEKAKKSEKKYSEDRKIRKLKIISWNKDG